MRWMKCLMAVVAFTAVQAAAAMADEGKTIDCADLAIQLKTPEFKLTCKDYSDPSAVSNAGRLGAEQLYAFSDSQEQIFVVWDFRATGSIYLKRHGFEEDVKDFFSGETLDEWQATEPVQGYEFANYVNRRSGSSEEECIAFRRQMNRRNAGVGGAGFGRMVIGIGCTTRERAVLIESLKRFEAPGD